MAHSRTMIKRRASEPRAAAPDDGTPPLPDAFRRWFDGRGWSPRDHQLALLAAARGGHSTLLIAPTGAGKTLAGFLPSLVRLSEKPRLAGLDTLYISPLKALAVDVARNLLAPIAELGLAIRTETRTGDTSVARRQRQRVRPPHILMTTPEQVALLLSHPDAPHLFGMLRTVILDELHVLAPSKRGDLLALGLARLHALAPGLVSFGLSATVASPSELRAFLVPQRQPESETSLARLVVARGGARPDILILELDEPVPWAGHSARYAMASIYDAIRAHRLSLVFVNTRMQAELVFQELWRLNDDALPIALHHGSLDAMQRRKVEAAMAQGALKAVVCTSTLDLGIDWGDVDLVINVGAPKGASRLAQRIGRANHRLDEASRALLVPANRFEVLECRAALEAALAGEQDARLSRSGALDVLAQHVLGMACQAPFDPGSLYKEVRTAAPYAGLSRATFDRVLDFVATGGYALRAYERFAKLRPRGDGRLRLAHPRLAQQYRMNAGTIVESPMLKVRLVGRARGRVLASGKGGVDRTISGVAGSPPPNLPHKGGGIASSEGHGKPPLAGARTSQEHSTGPLPLVGRVRVGGIPPDAVWSRSASRPSPYGERAGAGLALIGGRVLGEIEEDFVEQLTPGSAFVFAGEVLRLVGLRDTEVFVSRASATDPVIPSYAGGKFPLSTHLAARLRAMLADASSWSRLPAPVAEWLALQARYSRLPDPGEVLIETFPRGERHYLVAYPFEGRLAHQMLGMLLTRRLERAGAQPLGFVANDYGLAVWALGDLDGLFRAGRPSLAGLFDEDMLGDDLDAWLAASNLMKRTFRHVAVIAGLNERRHPGREKSGRQVTMSTDLVYDVLRRHDPHHILLEAAWADVATGLIDAARLGDFLRRVVGHVRHEALLCVSPLAVPILLEIGREPVAGAVREDLIKEAMRRAL